MGSGEQTGFIERALVEIGEGLASGGGAGFFPALVEHLGRAVGTEHAALCRLEEDAAPRMLSFIARWSAQDGVACGGPRELTGTPCCEVVDGRTSCSYPSGARRAFPRDALLERLGIESYAGAPLYDAAGRVRGVLAVLDTKPLERPDSVAALLGVLAKLAAVELERQEAFATLESSERLHAAVLTSAPFGVYEYRLDEDDRLILTGINAAALASAPMPVEHLIGLPLEEAFPFLTGTELPKAYRSVARGGGFWSHPQFELRAEELPAMTLEMYAFSTAPRSVAVMFHDITERVRGEEALRESEAQLQAFLHNAPFGAYFCEVRPGEAGETIYLLAANPAADRITGFDNQALLGLPLLEAFPPLAESRLPEIYLAVANGTRDTYHDPRFHFSGMGLEGVFDVHVFQVHLGQVAVLFLDVTSRARAEEAERAAERLEATATLAGGIAHELNNLMAGVMSNVALLRRGRPGSRRYEDTLGQVAGAAGRASDLAQQLLAYARGGRYETVQLDLNDAVREVIRRYRVALPETVALHSDLDTELAPIAADRPQLLLLIRCLLSNALEAVDPVAGLIVVRTREVQLTAEAAARLEIDPGAYAVITVADDGAGVPTELRDRVFEPFFSTRARGRGMGLAAAFGIARNHGGTIRVARTYEPPRDPSPPDAPEPPPTATMKRSSETPARDPDSDSGSCPPPEACGGAVFEVYLPLEESRGSFRAGTQSLEGSGGWIQASGILEGTGSLALGVAHDFNNLLALALNELDLLRRSSVEPWGPRLEVVHDTLLKCRSLTERLLQLGRGDSLERGAVSLNEVAADVAGLLSGALEASVELELALDPDLPTVLGARSLLENAILNLCFNARDAMPDGGRLRLESGRRAETGEVWLRVLDTGVGMADEVLRRAREPLFTTKSDGGTGLGLAMADRVARNHGGRLDVASQAGAGTQVTMSLPAGPTATRGEGLRGAGRVVLLIDDSEHIARSTSQLLELEGFRVESVGRGEEAIERFREREYDLVLLDVMLPGISGEMVFHELRALRPDQPIVVCSGYGRQEEVRGLVRRGAVFLPKPFLLEELLDRIEQVLAVR